MSRVVIIGGSGHVGTYLVPRLVEAGFDVVNVSRGERKPYRPHAAWKKVQTVALDRNAGDKSGSFAAEIRALKPDIVIDMICFTPDSARQLVEALRGNVQHFLSCGTIWVHGPSVEVPTTEMQPRRPFGEYGIQKAAIEALLLDEARRNGFPATIVHPGHIVGPGWAPLNPAGHFNPKVFTTLARGEQLALPNFGMETVHHVHADDVAQMFMRASPTDSSAGEAFHRFPGGRRCAAMPSDGQWFGHEPNLTFLPWPEWSAAAEEEARRPGAYFSQPEQQHRQGAAPARYEPHTARSRRCAIRDG